MMLFSPKKWPPDGIEHPRSFLVLTAMENQQISGVSAVFWLKFWLENLSFLEAQPWIKFRKFYHSQENRVDPRLSLWQLTMLQPWFSKLVKQNTNLSMNGSRLELLTKLLNWLSVCFSLILKKDPRLPNFSSTPTWPTSAILKKNMTAKIS